MFLNTCFSVLHETERNGIGAIMKCFSLKGIGGEILVRGMKKLSLLSQKLRTPAAFEVMGIRNLAVS
jgi:hypothetical protein